ncbi:MAG: autotransporter-associated beta strand repeat-containing protein [Pseudomonadota bacterium]
MKYIIFCSIFLNIDLKSAGTQSASAKTTTAVSATITTPAAITSVVTTNAGYDLNGTTRTIIDPSGSGIIQSSNSNAALTITLTNGSTFSGTIANTINSLTVNGSKTLILSGTNSYVGATSINAGSTLVGDISKSVGVTVSGTYDLSGTARTLIDLSGTGTIRSSGSTSAALILASSAFEKSTIFSGTLASTINGLTKTGPGTFIMSGTNNMTSSTITTISAGTLQIGAGSTTGSITSNSIVNNGILSFNRSNEYTYSGVISGTGILTQIGSGKTLLRGANTYTGNTIIRAGTLNIASTNNMGSGMIILAGGILQANANLILSQPITLTTEGTIATSTYSLTVSGNITGANSLRKNGKGVLILTGTNTYTGTTTITNGTLQIGSGSTSGSIASNSIVNNDKLTFNRSDATTYPGVIAGTGTFTTSGAGTIILSGANTYSGKTIINTGTMQIGAGATTGSIASSNIVNNATLSFNRSDSYTYTGVISGTGALQHIGSGTLTLPAANTYTGTTTINSGKKLIGNIGTSVGVVIAGIYDLNGTARTLIDPSGTGTIQSSNANAALTLTSKNGSTFSGIIANTIKNLTINGSKVLTLSLANAYTGMININSGSTLIGDIAASSGVTVSGTYDLNGTARTLIDPSGRGTIHSSGDKTATLTVTAQNGSNFSGRITSSINNVTKKGPGTLTFSGTTPYSGTVTVSTGTLALTNTSALSGTIDLSKKTTLSVSTKGTPIITNPITFGSSETDGNAIATINVNQPTTFSGAITCHAPSGTTGVLIISGGHTVTLKGKHIGTFAIILSGRGTNVIVQDEANTNTEILTGSTWFLLNN